jgi:hypothetical protein
MSWNVGLQNNNLYQIVKNLQTTALTNPLVSNLNMNGYSITGTNSFSTTNGITDTSTAGITCTNLKATNIVSNAQTNLFLTSVAVVQPQRTGYVIGSYLDATLGQITLLSLDQTFGTNEFTAQITAGSQVTLSGWTSPATPNGTWTSLPFNATYQQGPNANIRTVLVSTWLNGTFTGAPQQYFANAQVDIVSGGTVSLNSIANCTSTGIDVVSGKHISSDQFLPNITKNIDVASVALSATSTCYQVASGTTASTYTLPNATTIQNGFTFTFNNNNTAQAVIIRNFTSLTTLYTVPFGGNATCICLDNTTTNGTWEIHCFLPVGARFGSTALTYSGNLILSGAGTKTIESSVGTLTVNSQGGALALQNAGATSVSISANGVITASSANSLTLTSGAGTTSVILNATGAGGYCIFNVNGVQKGYFDANGFYVDNGSISTTSSFALKVGGSTVATIDATGLTVGELALSSNVANNNIVVGRNSFNYTNGISVGFNVGKSTQSGNANCLVGVRCGSNLTSGYNNAVFGSESGTAMTSGYQNTLIGSNAGNLITSGGLNVVVGQSAGSSMTTGDANVLLGQNAAPTLTTGNYNTYIGGLNVGASSPTVSNEIVVGNGGTGKGFDTFFTPVSNTYQGNNGATWSVISDINIKENIVPLSDVLSAVLSLNPVSYQYKETKKSDVGFIAQEYQVLFPEQITESAPNKYQQETLELSTILGIKQNLTPYLVKAVQEQHALVVAQQTEIVDLKAQLDLKASESVVVAQQTEIVDLKAQLALKVSESVVVAQQTEIVDLKAQLLALKAVVDALVVSTGQLVV